MEAAKLPLQFTAIQSELRPEPQQHLGGLNKSSLSMELVTMCESVFGCLLGVGGHTPR